MYIETVVGFSDVYLQLYSKNAPIEDGSSYERLTQKAYDFINYHYIHVKTLDLFVFISNQIRSLRTMR